MTHRRGPVCGECNPVFHDTPGSYGHNDIGDVDNTVQIAHTVGISLRSHGILIAQAGKSVQRRSRQERKRLSRTALYLHDNKEGKTERIMARALFGFRSKDVVKVDSWESLATTITNHSSIEHIVLSFHGYGGGIIVGNNSKYLDESSLKKLFLSKTGEVQTQIKKITFTSCNVGNRPAKMAAFAKYFNAASITGYTWFIVHQLVSATLYKGDTSKVDDLIKYRNVVFPKLNIASITAEVKRRDVKKDFLIIYGARNYAHLNQLDFPISFSKSRDFKPLGDARERRLSFSETAKVEKEMEDLSISEFEKITVLMKEMTSNE